MPSLLENDELLAFAAKGIAVRQWKFRVVVRIGPGSRRMARGISYN